MSTNATQPKSPRATRKAVRAAVVITGVIATVALIAPPTAYAETIEGTYGRNAVHQAAAWISQHSGATSAAQTGGTMASAACGPGAWACGALVNFYFTTLRFYGDVITTASSHNACIYEYDGDTQSTSDGAYPYIHEVNDKTCHD